MENQLISKQQILSSLKTSSSRMASSSSTFRIIDQDGTIQSVRYTLDNLSPSIEQLKLKSKSILSDWQEYNRVLLKMEKILQEAEAEIDRIETSAMNVETYEMSTRKAQVEATILTVSHCSLISYLGLFTSDGRSSTRLRSNQNPDASTIRSV